MEQACVQYDLAVQKLAMVSTLFAMRTLCMPFAMRTPLRIPFAPAAHALRRVQGAISVQSPQPTARRLLTVSGTRSSCLGTSSRSTDRGHTGAHSQGIGGTMQGIAPPGMMPG